MSSDYLQSLWDPQNLNVSWFTRQLLQLAEANRMHLVYFIYVLLTHWRSWCFVSCRVTHLHCTCTMSVFCDQFIQKLEIRAFWNGNKSLHFFLLSYCSESIHTCTTPAASNSKAPRVTRRGFRVRAGDPRKIPASVRGSTRKEPCRVRRLAGPRRCPAQSRGFGIICGRCCSDVLK